MKNKLSFVLLLLFTAFSFLFSGCSSIVSTDSKIFKDMTGMMDFINKEKNGETTIIVYGTIGNERDNKISKKLAETDIMYYKNAIIKTDKEVTEDDIKQNHIEVIGNPSTNAFFERINEKLPIRVDNEQLFIGDKALENSDRAMYRFVVPNPLNKRKYLYVNGTVDNQDLPYTYSIMHSYNTDYAILINKNEKYSGEFNKGDTEWTLDSLGDNISKLDDYKKVDSENFVFHYGSYDQNVEKDIRKIIETREKAYDTISIKLNMKYKDKIDYYFFLNKDWFMKNKDNDHCYWLGDCNDLYKEDDISYNYAIFKVLISQIGKPLNDSTEIGLYNWLFFEEKNPSINVKEVIISDNYIPLENLDAYYLRVDSDKEIIHTELYSFAKYMIEQYSIDKYMELFNANQLKEVDEALYEVYGKDLLELEEEWLEYVRGL